MTVILTIKDCRDCGYCVKGVKDRFAALNLDFARLIKHGIPVGELIEINDAQLQTAVAKAEERTNGQG